MLVAMMCRQRFADGILITEAHPKALLWLLGKATSGLPPRGVMMGDLNEYVAGNIVEGASEHERDAVLGAIAVFAMESQRTGWQVFILLTQSRHSILRRVTGCLSTWSFVTHEILCRRQIASLRSRAIRHPSRDRSGS
jgi:hypothetical protein